MALNITITDAGRAEIINAENTGTGPVVITQVGFDSGQYLPSKIQTALQSEIKRVATIGGQVVAADTIHVTVMDEGGDAYDVGGFGLFSASGTLVAVYSQPAESGWIIQKASASTLLLAIDIVLESLDATSLTFGDVIFINPPATTEAPGVVELATAEETQAGADGSRAVTPAGLKSLAATTVRAGLVQLNDTLTSGSTSQALTAAQGKKLQDEKQPKAGNLTAFAGLTGAADRLPYFTGAGALSLAVLTAKARELLAADSAVGMRTVLGLGTASLAALTTDRLSFATGSAMRVGDYGVGSTAISIIDPDTMYRPNGFYEVGETVSWAGRPVAGWTRILHMAHENPGGYASQLAFANFATYDADRVLFRTGSSGAWAGWNEFWHSGNFAPASKVTVDWIDTAGLIGNDLARPYMRRASDATLVELQTKLGFTPIQQAGGAYQTTNKVYIGWDGSNLRYQVDAVDRGQFWDDSNGFAKIAGGAAGAIGTYALLRLGGGSLGVAVPVGTLVAGSSCAYAAADGTASGAPGGTWRVMGHAYDADANSANSTTLCLRVS